MFFNVLGLAHGSVQENNWFANKHIHLQPASWPEASRHAPRELSTRATLIVGDAKTLVKASVALISSWAKHAVPQDQGTCLNRNDVYVVFGATWAS